MIRNLRSLYLVVKEQTSLGAKPFLEKLQDLFYSPPM